MFDTANSAHRACKVGMEGKSELAEILKIPFHCSLLKYRCNASATAGVFRVQDAMTELP